MVALQLRNTSGPLHRFTQFFSPLIPLNLLHERHTLDTLFLAASRGVTQVTVTTLGSTARTDNLYTIAVRAGKSVMLLCPAFDIYHDAVAARVM